MSAHAAGIERNTATLVGELTNYLSSVENIARQALSSAERYTQHDLYALGAKIVAAQATVEN